MYIGVYDELLSDINIFKGQKTLYQIQISYLNHFMKLTRRH